MTPERPLMQEFAVQKDSHFRTPRTLAECQFDDTGPSLGSRAGFFERPDRIVFWGCVGVAAVLLILYFAGRLA